MTTHPSAACVPVVESNFFGEAELLRTQFEARVVGSACLADLNPFNYLAATSQYQCIVARAEHIFSEELFLAFMNHLRAWALRRLSASHASTPRLSIYVHGCWRELLRDEGPPKWHYLLCLTRTKRRVKPVGVLCEPPTRELGDTRSARRWLWSTPLKFNQILLHLTSQPYGIEEAKTSLDPLENMVLLDGYLW
jgi:hypothetical protein